MITHDFSEVGHLYKDSPLGEEKIDRQGMVGSVYLQSQVSFRKVCMNVKLLLSKVGRQPQDTHMLKKHSSKIFAAEKNQQP